MVGVGDPSTSKLTATSGRLGPRWRAAMTPPATIPRALPNTGSAPWLSAAPGGQPVTADG